MKRRGGWRAGFWQRFARYDSRLKQALTNRHTLWVHAVSVGEVNIATQLIKALESRAPNLTVVVSTTTSTGMGELRKKLPAHVPKFYYPIDRAKYVSRALRVINPEAIVLVEAEIWPNFLWKAADRHIPTFLVNARLSQRSYRGYRRAAFLFRRIFRNFTGVGAQNDADAQRLIDLGCRPEVVRIVGNLKFDAAQIAEKNVIRVDQLYQQIGMGSDALILIGGSTHDGEEAYLADVFLRLRARFPKLFLTLVPRHMERSREVGTELEKRKIRFVYRNEISSANRYGPGEIQALIVNTTGELRHFYENATVVFVGKTLTAEGGQNPIEPGALGKAMVFGPNMQNFEAIAAAFVNARAARQERDAAGVERAIAELLASAEQRGELGKNALKVVSENRGSIERTLDMILENITLD
ncbi:MAG TPA: glycosyltransferase N-terminal domain-containing protein [Verrucomicrobiae bacterium]|nr:glycosyltransferase N-terminal domain-containing protein [Verrucomicrobiae bacterium]